MTAQKRKTVLYTFDCSGCGYCTEVCDSGILKLVDNGTCRFVNVALRAARNADGANGDARTMRFYLNQ